MKLEIPEGRFQAYLFDMDGTIANSLPLHFRAWKEALEPHGAVMPEDLFYAWGGIPVPRTVELLNEHLTLKMPVEVVTRAREEAYHALLPGVTSHEAVESLIKQNFRKIPMAVVSGSSRASVEKTLRKLELWTYFDLIVGAEDCRKGKPDPEPFLTAARMLNVAPELCLAFEDAEPGIQSARAAGMQVVRIPQRPDTP